MIIKTILGITIAFILLSANEAKAVSEADCAIWLCLPHGFSPSECGAAKSAWRKRIKKRRPQLPKIKSCEAKYGGFGTTDSNYRTGIERWEDCKEGYKPVYHLHPIKQKRVRSCVAGSCIDPRPDILGDFKCNSYIAGERDKQNFIQMWIDGEDIGKFYY